MAYIYIYIYIYIYTYTYIKPFFNLYAYLTLHKRYSQVTAIVLLYFILSAISTRHVTYT